MILPRLPNVAATATPRFVCRHFAAREPLPDFHEAQPERRHQALACQHCAMLFFPFMLRAL